MIYTLQEGQSFDAELLRLELVAAIGPDGWHLNTAGNTVEFVGDFDASSVIAAHFGNGAAREVAKTVEAAKAVRQKAVAALTVTTAAGNVFDGDETSQTRMARAILALQATGTQNVKWVLANNTPTVVTVAELVEALALAGAAQAAIWSRPYE